MIYSANEIVPNLYIGGIPPRGSFLAESGIDTLVLCAKENQDASLYSGIEVVLAPGDDDSRYERLLGFLDEWTSAADLVVDRVTSGKNVLVTCMMGHNRSGFVTALALHRLTGWDGKKCVQYVSSKRTHALNNTTFAQYLIDNLK